MLTVQIWGDTALSPGVAPQDQHSVQGCEMFPCHTVHDWLVCGESFLTKSSDWRICRRTLGFSRMIENLVVYLGSGESRVTITLRKKSEWSCN